MVKFISVFFIFCIFFGLFERKFALFIFDMFEYAISYPRLTKLLLFTWGYLFPWYVFMNNKLKSTYRLSCNFIQVSAFNVNTIPVNYFDIL